ncbi:hypothetical protein BDB01DRAFT_263301 [Pilobolus umbonatus]|nr:hypothetical protein BDB01DRAFT_263301 [Pilobolus umbonatus]
MGIFSNCFKIFKKKPVPSKPVEEKDTKQKVTLDLTEIYHNVPVMFPFAELWALQIKLTEIKEYVDDIVKVFCALSQPVFVRSLNLEAKADLVKQAQQEYLIAKAASDKAEEAARVTADKLTKAMDCVDIACKHPDQLSKVVKEAHDNLVVARKEDEDVRSVADQAAMESDEAQKRVVEAAEILALSQAIANGSSIIPDLHLLNASHLSTASRTSTASDIGHAGSVNETASRPPDNEPSAIECSGESSSSDVGH